MKKIEIGPVITITVTYTLIFLGIFLGPRLVSRFQCANLIKENMKFPETTKILSFSKVKNPDSSEFRLFEPKNLYQGAYSSKNGFGLDSMGHFICGTYKGKKTVYLED